MVACAKNGTWYVASTFVVALSSALAVSPMSSATGPA
jgi:hypothetical protein